MFQNGNSISIFPHGGITIHTQADNLYWILSHDLSNVWKFQIFANQIINYDIFGILRYVIIDFVNKQL